MFKVEKSDIQSPIFLEPASYSAMENASECADWSSGNKLENLNEIYSAKFGPFNLKTAFQPIYAVTPDHLTLFAFEALVRPEKSGSMVLPSVLFNPDAGYNLSELDRLCRSIHIRNYQLLHNDNATLFLNINPAYFCDKSSIDRELDDLIEDLDTFNISTSKLVCEIIETKAANDHFISRLCDGLREMGAKVAVDDYGSHHSNWQRFELVQPDILKLDGPVFRNLCKTAGAITALEKLTDSLHEIGCILLVEGVETRNQFDIAIAAGISLMQGYFLARPAKTAQQYPAIPTAPFLPGQNKVHLSQAFRPTILFNDLSDPI